MARGDARLRISAEDRTARAFESIDRRMKNAAKTAMGLAGGLAGIGSVFAISKKLVEVGRSFDVINASLVTVTGSSMAASKAFGQIQKFAATTPFSLEEVANAFIKMKALGLDPSEKALKSYGNTASAMGKSLNQMIEAVADAATGEFERLKEFGIKSSSQGDKVSFTFRGITTTVGKNAKEIEGYLKKIGDVDFAGAMEKRSATLDGALSNLGDSWDNLFLSIYKGGVGAIIQENVKLISKALNDLSESVSKSSVQIGKGVDFIGNAMNGLSFLFKAFVIRSKNDTESLSDMFNKITDPKVVHRYEDAAKKIEQAKERMNSSGTGKKNGSEKNNEADTISAANQKVIDMQQAKFDKLAQMALDADATDEERAINAFQRQLDAIDQQQQSLMDNKSLWQQKGAELEDQFNQARENATAIHMAKIHKIQEAQAKKSASMLASVEASKVQTIFGIGQTLIPMITKNAKAQVAIQAALSAAEVFMNYQVASARALAELGPIAGAPVAAAMQSKMLWSMGAIAANAALKIGGGGSGGGSGSGGGGSSFGGAVGTYPASPNTGLPAETQPATVVHINLEGNSYTPQHVRDLIEAINEQVGNNVALRVNG